MSDVSHVPRRSRTWLVVILVVTVLVLGLVAAGLVISRWWPSSEPTEGSTQFVDLYRTDLPTHTTPKDLLVLVFNYDSDGYTDPDEEIEQSWSDYIFGTGSYEQGTASINDYFKEISQGLFSFAPVLLDDNTTGVYSFHLDKEYSDEQGLHQEWPFFEYLYDVMHALDSLSDRGLDISRFAASGVDNTNYGQVMIDYFASTQKDRPAQWYATSSILCVFPPYNTEKMDFTPLSSSLDAFTFYAHINYNTPFGVIAHELGHLLGAIDVYNFGAYPSDLMSTASKSMPDPYNVSHIDPFYKLIFGWQEPIVIQDSGNVTLYPATSEHYQPAIIVKDDPNQYYIIENRRSEKFDTGLAENAAEGINIWRIDKLGCEAIYELSRKGISLEGVLSAPGDEIEVLKYTSTDNIKDVTEEPANIEISYLTTNPDNSITATIRFI